jgi:uncharacterized protein (DUF2147 family)
VKLPRLGVVLAPFGVALLAALGRPAIAASPNPEGQWLTQDRDGVIEIAPCAEALCGRIVGIRRSPAEPVPMDAAGQPQCGLVILRDEMPAGDGSWDGHITDPRDGKTYGAQLWLDDERRLHIRGYLGLPLLGRTQIWTRFSGRIGEECRF